MQTKIAGKNELVNYFYRISEGMSDTVLRKSTLSSPPSVPCSTIIHVVIIADGSLRKLLFERASGQLTIWS